MSVECYTECPAEQTNCHSKSPPPLFPLIARQLKNNKSVSCLVVIDGQIMAIIGYRLLFEVLSEERKPSLTQNCVRGRAVCQIPHC